MFDKLGIEVYNNSSIQEAVYNLKRKEDANMKKRMIAMALLIVMIFALAACGGKQEAAPAEQPAAQDAAPADTAPADAAPADAAPADAAPADTPEAQEPAEQPGEDDFLAAAIASGIPDGSGVVTITSEDQGFSIDFDSDKYTAFPNQVGNIDIYAGQEEGIPMCSVMLRLKENTDDAVAFLKSTAESIEIEQGKNMVKKADEPKKVDFGDRDLYYIVCTYKDKDAGGNVQCVYYAENLKSGDVAVYTSRALEGQTDDVQAILQRAVQTFKFGA